MAYYFDSFRNGQCWEHSFVGELDWFTKEEKQKLLAGEQIYDTYHNDGSECGLSLDELDFIQS